MRAEIRNRKVQGNMDTGIWKWLICKQPSFEEVLEEPETPLVICIGAPFVCLKWAVSFDATILRRAHLRPYKNKWAPALNDTRWYPALRRGYRHSWSVGVLRRHTYFFELVSNFTLDVHVKSILFESYAIN